MRHSVAETGPQRGRAVASTRWGGGHGASQVLRRQPLRFQRGLSSRRPKDDEPRWSSRRPYGRSWPPERKPGRSPWRSRLKGRSLPRCPPRSLRSSRRSKERPPRSSLRRTNGHRGRHDGRHGARTNARHGRVTTVVPVVSTEAAAVVTTLERTPATVVTTVVTALERTPATVVPVVTTEATAVVTTLERTPATVVTTLEGTAATVTASSRRSKERPPRSPRSSRRSYERSPRSAKRSRALLLPVRSVFSTSRAPGCSGSETSVWPTRRPPRPAPSPGPRRAPARGPGDQAVRLLAQFGGTALGPLQLLGELGDLALGLLRRVARGLGLDLGHRPGAGDLGDLGVEAAPPWMMWRVASTPASSISRKIWRRWCGRNSQMMRRCGPRGPCGRRGAGSPCGRRPGSTFRTRSTPSTWMPRAATSVATRTLT
ncbi:hypothetical protein STENM36S_09358 [Streptomyces tendae]